MKKKTIGQRDLLHSEYQVVYVTLNRSFLLSVPVIQVFQTSAQ